MDLYDIAVARKLSSGGGGGGGSSDFSTATVTFNVSGTSQVNAPFILTAPLDPPIDYIDPMGSKLSAGEYDIVLYKGIALLMCNDLTVSGTASGAIEHLAGDVYKVTGDCTITIS